jgi:nucleoside-diphosphate-sugar epimerase
MRGAKVVFHAATLHKPHVGTHGRQDFVDTNISGTLNLLEEATHARVDAFVFTSTTSVYGDALAQPAGAPARWVTEDLQPVPKNIYGVTKAAAENLCELFHRRHELRCIILRTSRFFPEADDDKAVRDTYDDANTKANEYLFRRVDIADAVSAHLLAAERAPAIGLGRYIISATTPFLTSDLAELSSDAPSVTGRRVPGYEAVYAQRGWRMVSTIDRVYDNQRARIELGWQPRHDFRSVIDRLSRGGDIMSPLARLIGSKGYHLRTFSGGPYPVE